MISTPTNPARAAAIRKGPTFSRTTKAASGTSHTGKKAFKEITSVSSSASITGADLIHAPLGVNEAMLPFASIARCTAGNITGFDYVAGRPIKVWLRGDELCGSYLYDRDAGLVANFYANVRPERKDAA